jgi:hypothetical protein
VNTWLFYHLVDMLAHEISVLRAPTHPLSLNFCSSLSKAKPKAMQEIRDNTSVYPCLDSSNRLMRPYLAVPTYLIELFVEFFTSSWAVERWNLSSVSLLLSCEINRREYDTIILWFLTSAQQMFLLILPSKG